MRMKFSTSESEFFAEFCSFTSSEFSDLLYLEGRAINLSTSSLVHGLCRANN